MKKRIITVLLTLVLLLGLSVCVFAESQLWHITDDAGILTSDENSELEAYAQSVSETYGVGVYIVIVNDYSDYYDDPYETAYQIYHEYTLGEGDDRDGLILLLSMDNRKFATFFYGPQAEYAFDAYGQELLEHYFLDDFRADDWANGCRHFLSGCEYFLSQAADGAPIREDDYSSDSDSSGSSFRVISWRVIGLIAFGSMFFSLIVCVLLKSKMKSVRKASAANAYVSGDLNLTASHDQFTHTTETRTRIERESSSGGSHAESGGGGSGRSGSF